MATSGLGRRSILSKRRGLGRKQTLATGLWGIGQINRPPCRLTSEQQRQKSETHYCGVFPPEKAAGELREGGGVSQTPSAARDAETNQQRYSHQREAKYPRCERDPGSDERADEEQPHHIVFSIRERVTVRHEERNPAANRPQPNRQNAGG